MPAKRPPQDKKPEEMSDEARAQHKRFKEAAREHGADESGKKFEEAFGKIVPPKRKPN